MKYESQSDAETRDIAKRVMEDVIHRFPRGPLLVGLVGDLGAGKTTFMKGVAEYFGITDPVTSPTFIIQKLYPIDEANRETRNHGFHQLVHMDLYRLEGEGALSALRWSEYEEDSKNIVCVEWPHQVWQAPPENMIQILFHHEGEGRRTISYEKQ